MQAFKWPDLKVNDILRSQSREERGRQWGCSNLMEAGDKPLTQPSGGEDLCQLQEHPPESHNSVFLFRSFCPSPAVLIRRSFPGFDCSLSIVSPFAPSVSR